MDSFSFAIKDQLSYNKKIESQLVQLATALPFATNLEKVNAITTRGGKSTCDPPFSIRTGKTQVVMQEEEKRNDEVEEVEPQERELQQDFHDTTFLLFPRRNRKTKMDEQFGKFVEVIQKIYINISLLDAIHVPTTWPAGLLLSPYKYPPPSCSTRSLTLQSSFLSSKFHNPIL